MNFLTNLFKKKYLTSKIKKDLIKGGLIITPRRSGKSEAIVELLNESTDYVLVCANQDQMNMTRERLIKKNFKNKFKINSLIVGPTYNFKGLFNKKIIIDEYFYNSAADKIDNWHTAISTFNKDAVIYDKKGKRIVVKTEEIF
jgi:AAA+ ATPase superfamily predicted ATPase